MSATNELHTATLIDLQLVSIDVAVTLFHIYVYICLQEVLYEFAPNQLSKHY